MPWSAETALNELWSGLDTTKAAGEVRRYLKQHLQAAFDAGLADEMQRAATISAFTPSHTAT